MRYLTLLSINYFINVGEIDEMATRIQLTNRSSFSLD